MSAIPGARFVGIGVPDVVSGCECLECPGRGDGADNEPERGDCCCDRFASACARRGSKQLPNASGIAIGRRLCAAHASAVDIAEHDQRDGHRNHEQHEVDLRDPGPVPGHEVLQRPASASRAMRGGAPRPRHRRRWPGTPCDRNWQRSRRGSAPARAPGWWRACAQAHRLARNGAQAEEPVGHVGDEPRQHADDAACDCGCGAAEHGSPTDARPAQEQRERNRDDDADEEQVGPQRDPGHQAEQHPPPFLARRGPSRSARQSRHTPSRTAGAPRSRDRGASTSTRRTAGRPRPRALRPPHARVGETRCARTTTRRGRSALRRMRARRVSPRGSRRRSRQRARPGMRPSHPGTGRRDPSPRTARAGCAARSVPASPHSRRAACATRAPGARGIRARARAAGRGWTTGCARAWSRTGRCRPVPCLPGGLADGRCRHVPFLLHVPAALHLEHADMATHVVDVKARAGVRLVVDLASPSGRAPTPERCSRRRAAAAT